MLDLKVVPKAGVDQVKGHEAMNVRKGRAAFTLIEVLIVVVIMAVLAATIIPQFSTSTRDAKHSSLKFNLQQLRSQIELYKIHHAGNTPATLDLLTKPTDVTGATTGGSLPYGPYVQGGLPINPFTGSAAVAAYTGATAPTAATAATGGWQYKAATGELWPDGNVPSGLTAAEYYTP